MVHLRDYLDEERIIVLEGGTKDDVLNRLIELSRSERSIRDFQKFRREVLKRESIVSTGIGMGVALPHVKTDSVSSFFITVGVFKNGVDWDSLDGKPVHIIVLIAAPEGEHETYIRLLAQAAEVFRHEDLRRTMIETGDPQTSYKMLIGGKPSDTP